MAGAGGVARLGAGVFSGAGLTGVGAGFGGAAGVATIVIALESLLIAGIVFLL